MRKVVIVIPAYKEKLNSLEILSFRQGLTILFNYDIALICPRDLIIDEYVKMAEECGKKLVIERFDSVYFENILAYNKLLLSVEFYKRFRQYKKLLIYQTDAFVFKDELEYWCDKDYDYIGAPWFEGFHLNKGSARIIGAGNGGFSLRNVSKCKNILAKRDRIKVLLRAVYSNGVLKNVPINYLGKIFKVCFDLRDSNTSWRSYFDELSDAINDSEMHEDYFWALVAPRYFTNFNVADYSAAMYFSFENHPRELYKMTNSQLPFGCHGWERYDPEFWSNFIDGSMERD